MDEADRKTSGSKDMLRKAIMANLPAGGEVRIKGPELRPKHNVPVTLQTGVLVIPNVDKRFFIQNGRVSVWTDAELALIVQHHSTIIAPGWTPEFED